MKFDFSFHVGEKVRFYQYIICDVDEMELNETGIITNIVSNGARGSVFLGVQWEKKKDARHDCKGTCESGHGWYVRDDEVIRI